MAPSLPSVLPFQPGLQDVSSTNDKIYANLAKVTTPAETPIFICGFQDCCRLFPSRDRVMLHRKRDHESEDDRDIITWNDPV